jgi:hypothetical protein
MEGYQQRLHQLLPPRFPQHGPISQPHPRQRPGPQPPPQPPQGPPPQPLPQPLPQLPHGLQLLPQPHEPHESQGPQLSKHPQLFRQHR